MKQTLASKMQSQLIYPVKKLASSSVCSHANHKILKTAVVLNMLVCHFTSTMLVKNKAALTLFLDLCTEHKSCSIR